MKCSKVVIFTKRALGVNKLFYPLVSLHTSPALSESNSFLGYLTNPVDLFKGKN